MTAPPGTQGVTYEVGSIHDSIFYRMSAVEGKLQNLLLFFAPLRHKLFLRKYTNRDEGTTSRPARPPPKIKRTQNTRGVEAHTNAKPVGSCAPLQRCQEPCSAQEWRWDNA